MPRFPGTHVGAWIALAASLAFVPRAVHAHFEGALLSSRTASLGGAFVAIADDPSAVVDNPAGLSGLFQPSLLATYRKPYGVEGLDEGFVALSVPARWVTVGAAWFHRGLDGALSENRATLSLARDLKRTSEDASLSVGASVDFAHVSAQGSIDRDETAVSLGAGVLLRPFAFIGLGYTVRNINAPSIDLVDVPGATKLPRAHAVGISYYRQSRVTFTFERFQGGWGDAAAWRSRGGLELTLGPHVVLRGGLDGEGAAAGIGLAWQAVVFDAGFLSHDALGESYIVTLRYARRQPARPYGSTR